MIFRPQLGNAARQLIPTDKTATWATISTFDDNRYYLYSTLHQSPKVRSVVLNIVLDGVHHVSDAGKKISFFKSTDTAQTWGSKQLFYDPTDGAFQAQDIACGYSNNGRFHALVGCHDSVGTPGGNHELRYMYSDDDGTTVSSPSVVTLPSTTLNAWRVHDKIIDLGNGVMICPAYWATDEGDPTQSERWVIKTTDGGATWNWILVEGPTTAYINEGSILAITNNILIMINRYEDVFQFWMYKSTDQGTTWTSVGAFGTTILLDSPHGPPVLRKFKADTGKWYAVMYFPWKSQGRLYAMYGRLDNGVDAGLGMFNTSTVTLLFDDTSQLHYGDCLHYNNNMNARGAWPREAGSFPTDNTLRYFTIGTTHYNTVAALIDPVTIYDKLGVISFIGSARGLVSNTTNDYGVVNGSSQVTTLKSIAPGPLSQNFTATAGGIVLNSGAMDFDGTKALTHGTSLYWKFLHYSSAGYTDVNYTIYMVCKIGTSSNPNAVYSLVGNSAAAATTPGLVFYYDDRVSVPRSDSFRIIVSKNTAGFNLDFDNQNVITPNTYAVICIEVDLSQATQNNKAKLYVNNSLISTTVTTFSSSITSNNPTHSFQIGAAGNNVALFVGSIKDVIIQNLVDLPSVRTNFTTALMAINGI